MSGPIGARELAEASGIARQDIYRVMVTLEEKGFAEKLLSMPTVYKALPVRQVTDNLLNRQLGLQVDLQERTHRLVSDLQNSNNGKTIQDEESQFVMIPGKEAIVQRLADTISRINQSLEVVTSSERFSSAILEFSKGYASAIDRGVKIRIAFEKHMPQNGAMEILKNLQRNQNFEVRVFPDNPEALVSIFDSKEASVTISKTANYSKARALWSNDSGFVTLARNYFDNMWSRSSKIE